MKFPDFSIRWKLLAGFVGLGLLVLLVVLFSVSRILDDRIRDDINTNFRDAGKIFEQLQDIRFRQLHQTATLVAEMPYLKAAISTGDVNTVNNQIKQELVRLLHFDPLISDSLSSDPFTVSGDSLGLMMVFDRNGIPLGQLADSDLPESSMIDRAGVRTALEGDFPRQSYIWKQGDNYFNVITLPVFLQDQVIAALSLGYPIRNIEADLLAQLIEYEVSYFVDEHLITTSFPSLSEQGKRDLARNIQDILHDAGQNLQNGTTAELNINDQRWLVYVLSMVEYDRNEAGITGYYMVAQSLTRSLEPLYELQRVIYLIGIGGILIAIVLGITLTNNLTHPINLLMEGIQRIENEEYDQPVEVVSRDEIGQLTRTFNKLVSHIKENIREKETLLGEIHHRVKNNLAVISGLLELEGENAKHVHTERILKNSQLRIQSMATVHELLYQAQNFNNLSFDQFVTKMMASIKEVYVMDQTNVEVKLDVTGVQLNVNQAVPCGLIINELVTNAFKHAYPEDKSGVIKVTLKEQSNHMIFIGVEDEGVGLPNEWDMESSESLGFTLIDILARQLNAEVKIENQNGTSISVIFQKQDKKGASSTLNV